MNSLFGYPINEVDEIVYPKQTAKAWYKLMKRMHRPKKPAIQVVHPIEYEYRMRLRNMSQKEFEKLYMGKWDIDDKETT